jgi:phosphoserine phosphatase
MPFAFLTLTESARSFIDRVLALQPKLAVFDCDGTLWSGDSGADFFYFEIDRGLISPEVAQWALARYGGYLAGTVDEITICGEMVTIHEGIPEETIRAMVREFFAAVVEPRIFPEMQALAHRLAAAGCELWAVSSTNNWVVEEAVTRFSIPCERVLAATVAIDHGRASKRLLRVPSDELKATAIQEVIRRPVDAVFGNSMHDLAMLEIAAHPFAINSNPDLEKIARQRNWSIYQPQGIAMKK